MSRTRAALNEFRTSQQGRVLLHPQQEQFAYSDGQEVEDRILAALQGTADLSVGSLELMAKIQDWPTEYHFSDTRVNLLRHLPLASGARVLELGAGCGALTRFLGESGCEVVAVEGSLLRARCASERTRDLDNVSVYCANFQDIAFSGGFDVVTLIGVLEYAPKFFAGEDPIGACLQVARSALAPGGTLVLAIENQLGLKYFAGATEDHLGTHFSGIENRYQPDGVRTMGRQQVERALRAAGFAAVSFQYPFPDYKLPVALLFEAALGRADFRPSEIVRHLYARDYAGKDLRAIDTSQVWPVLEDNGLLGDLANSFLVLAQQASSPPAMDGADPDLLALAYSAGRAKRYQTRTTFRAGAGVIRCEKTRVYPDEPQEPPSPGIAHRLTREAYLPGSTLHSRITAAVRSGDAEGVRALLRYWLAYLLEIAGTGATPEDRLPGEYWDCTPTNLIEAGGALHYFDAEWVAQPGPRVRDLVLRYLFSLGFGEGTGPQFRTCFNATWSAPAIRSIVADLGMPLTEDILADLSRDLTEKNAAIFPLKPAVVLDTANFHLHDNFDGPPPAPTPSPKSGPQDMVLKVFRGISRVLTR